MKDSQCNVNGSGGHANPFRVPEHYFDSFATRLMDELPPRQPATVPMSRVVHKTPRRWLMSAACLLAIVASATAYWAIHRAGNVVEPQSTMVANEPFEQEFADYTMMDNADIYAFLSDPLNE